jgi:hypothetical protein
MTFDRDAVQLTNFIVPRMRRPMAPRPERDSIYGNTYGGVPNPMIPHQHPYPTRYHGPVFNYPQPGYRYATRPYAEVPFNGADGEAKIFGMSAPMAILGAGAVVLLGFLVFSPKVKF